VNSEQRALLFFIITRAYNIVAFANKPTYIRTHIWRSKKICVRIHTHTSTLFLRLRFLIRSRSRARSSYLEHGTRVALSVPSIVRASPFFTDKINDRFLHSSTGEFIPNFVRVLIHFLLHLFDTREHRRITFYRYDRYRRARNERPFERITWSSTVTPQFGKQRYTPSSSKRRHSLLFAIVFETFTQVRWPRAITTKNKKTYSRRFFKYCTFEFAIRFSTLNTKKTLEL